MNNSARASRVLVSADARGLVSQAGAVLLWETMRVTGLGGGLSESLSRWRAPRAVHDPAKIAGCAGIGPAAGVGTQTAPAAAVLRRRAPGPRRLPPAAAPRRTLALGRRGDRRRHPPAGPPVRLTSRNHPDDAEGAIRARGTPARRRDSRAASHGRHPKIITSRTVKGPFSSCL